jgi:amino acid permease
MDVTQDMKLHPTQEPDFVSTNHDNNESHVEHGCVIAPWTMTAPVEERHPRTAATLLAAAATSTPSSSSYSSFMGAVFNFTNCIVGAGAIGLGGAIAQSGGAISIFAILCFAVLTKLSLDLVMELSLRYCDTNKASYEELGFVAFGNVGRTAVLCCKFLYSFGCLVAYLIVVKDNFASALQHFIFGSHHHHAEHDAIYNLLSDSSLITFSLSVSVLLPLCLLRDMSPLAHLSMLSVLAMTIIVGIVLSLFFIKPNIRLAGNGVYVNWFQVRPGILERYDVVLVF